MFSLVLCDTWGWLGEANVSFILHVRHRGVQLRLAYSWTKPAIIAAGKGRGGWFYLFSIFTFIHFPFSPLSLSFTPSTISSIFLLPFSGRRHKINHKGWRVVKPHPNTINQCDHLAHSGILISYKGYRRGLLDRNWLFLHRKHPHISYFWLCMFIICKDHVSFFLEYIFSR